MSIKPITTIVLALLFPAQQAFGVVSCNVNAEGEVTNLYACTIEPDEYTFTLIELGLCETIPNNLTISKSFDREASNCTQLFLNPNGTTLQFSAKNSPLPLRDNEVTPTLQSNIVYRSSYAIISPSIGITVDSVTFADSKRPTNGAQTVYDGEGQTCWSKDATHWSFVRGSSNFAEMNSIACGSSNSPKGSVTNNWNSLDTGNNFLSSLQFSTLGRTGTLYLINASEQVASDPPTGKNWGDVENILVVENLSPVSVTDALNAEKTTRISLQIGKSNAVLIKGTGPDDAEGDDPHDLSKGQWLRNFVPFFPDLSLKVETN